MENTNAYVQDHKLSDVLMNAPTYDAVLVGDSYVLEFANYSFRKLLKSGEELIAKPFESITFQWPLDIVSVLKKVAFYDEAIEEEIVFNSKIKGKALCIKFIFHPYKNDLGKTIGVVMHGVDFTDEHHKRKELEANAQRLDHLLTNLPGGVYRFNVNDPWNFVFMSIGVAEISGYDLDELEADFVWKNIIHPDDQMALNDALEEISSGQSSNYTLNYRIKTKEGNYTWLSDRGQSISDKKGNTFIEGFIADITDRKLSEEIEKKNQFLFQTYAEAMPQMAFVADAVGDIIYYNQRWYDYVKNTENTEGWGWKDKPIHHPDDLERTVETWQRALSSGESYEIEYRLRRYDGAYRWHLGRAEPVRNEEGKIEMWLGTNTDIHNQKLIEEELRVINHRFDLISKATKDVIWDWDLQNDRLWWNDAMTDVFGYEYNDTISELSWWEQRVHPDDFPRISFTFKELLEAKATSWMMEYRFKRSDGSYAEILDRAYIQYNSEGRALRIIGSMIDITSSKEIEKALRDSEEHFRTLADNISQLAWITDESGDITWYNRRWYDYTGTTLEQVKGWGWKRCHHPEHVDRVANKISESFAKGVVWEDTFPLKGRDGSYRWFLSRAVPIRDEEGKVKHWFGTNTDITDLRDAEEALRKSEEYNRLLLESSPDCIKALDFDGTLQSINKQGLKMLELDSFDIIKGKNWIHFWDGEDRKKVQEAVDGAIKGNISHFQGFKATVKGTPKWWDILIAPVYDGKGKVEALTAVSRDITKLKQLEQQKDEFISVASHELKTPVTSIKGSIEIIETLLEDKAYDMIGRFVGKASTHVDKLLGLINDLLDVSRIQSGKLEYHFSEFTVAEIVEDCVEQMIHQSKGHQVIIKGDFNQVIIGDKVRLEQVVCNLLTNAIKYSPNKKEVIVEAKDLADAVEISVIDHGIGIPAEQMEHIFDRFFRVEQAYHDFQGVGLGLYISSEIIARHQSQLQVESKEGEGSRFYFKLAKA
ncbi:PAS domain S-box protein [Fulvivirga ligni]|uniref:PAS domain S-box protein n=1 Tax=Fulvivirga ligni TaxID=2904246 RepID=UPI001F3CDB37|nr:PAS domain S-box protein [Fulvivirga ligni]UII20176.1 PAS domain S-box protein [Fulvivirga ligni]